MKQKNNIDIGPWDKGYHDRGGEGVRCAKLEEQGEHFHFPLAFPLIHRKNENGVVSPTNKCKCTKTLCPLTSIFSYLNFSSYALVNKNTYLFKKYTR